VNTPIDWELFYVIFFKKGDVSESIFSLSSCFDGVKEISIDLEE